MTQITYAKQYEKYAFDKYSREGELPGIAHCKADGLDEEDVKRESWSLTKGTVGNESHEQCTNDRCQCDGCEGRSNRVAFISQWGKQGRQQGQNIGHRGEGGEA